MPNITFRPESWPTCLDDLRREPSRLVFPTGIRRLEIVKSYDGLKSLPQPILLPGGRKAWEGRTILQAIGAGLGLTDDEKAADAMNAVVDGG
jgi:hypothetical protein